MLKKLQQEIKVYEDVYEDNKEEHSVREWAREMAAPKLYDKSIVSSWVSNLEYSISCIQTGHPPGSYQGIERRGAHKNTKPIDPLLLQRYFRSQQPQFPWDDHQQEHCITPSEQEVINQALSILSEKELEAYLMYKGYSFSQYKIAEMMGVSRSSVKTMIKRANDKISHILSEMNQKKVI
jgi:positive control factor